MQKKFLAISALALCVFACGCENNQTVEPVVNPEPVVDVQCSDDCLEDIVEDLDNEVSEIVEVDLAKKNEGEDMITVSEGDLNSESIPESDVFEAPID